MNRVAACIVSVLALAVTLAGAENFGPKNTEAGETATGLLGLDHRFFVEEKEIGSVGDDRTKNTMYKLPLSRDAPALNKV